MSSEDAQRRMGLMRTQQCPVCGGTEREPAHAMSKSGVQYLQRAADRLGVSVGDLIERAQVFKCVTCRSYFCDPWLSPEFASWLFCAATPDHIVGWEEFEFWVRNRKGRFELHNQRVYAAVTRRTGPLRSYAEFGCPFQGFLLPLKAHEADPEARIRLFARALRRAPDVRWTRFTRLYNALEGFLRGALVLALRIRAILDRIIDRRRADASPEQISSRPESLYLLTHDTTRAWSSNCTRYGASCKYFARTILDAHVIPMDEARGQGLTFDLVGVFNILDHTTFPSEVLRTLLDVSRHVLVVSHDARRAGKQHMFALGDDFAEWLRESITGVCVEDLRDEVDVGGASDYSYLLLTKTSVIARPLTDDQRRMEASGIGPGRRTP